MYSMIFLTAIVFLHEYIAKTFIPNYKIKSEAREAATRFVHSCFGSILMAQAQLNRSGILSLEWSPAKDTIKCLVNSRCSIKLESKGEDIYLVIQDGNSRIRMHRRTFDTLYEFKESISFLISFIEGHSRHDDNERPSAI